MVLYILDVFCITSCMSYHYLLSLLLVLAIFLSYHVGIFGEIICITAGLVVSDGVDYDYCAYLGWVCHDVT
jgi:hypothetical protein